MEVIVFYAYDELAFAWIVLFDAVVTIYVSKIRAESYEICQYRH